MFRASTTVTLTDTSVPTPVSSVLSPIPGTSKMQPKMTPKAAVIKNTKRSDSIMRRIIAKIQLILIMSHYLNLLYMFVILIAYFHLY